MVTLHIENTVHDYESWRRAFDKFERFRADAGVRRYRVLRDVTDGNRVVIDLDFDTAEEAVSFRGALEKIWRTPQSQGELVEHGVPVLYDVAVTRDLSAAAASTA